MSASKNTRRQHPTPTSSSLDWRLVGGAIGIVAGLLLPLGGFKWILMLAGVALLGWFGMTRSQGKPLLATDHLSDQLVAAGLAPDLPASEALQQLELVAALHRAQAAVTTADQALATQAA